MIAALRRLLAPAGPPCKGCRPVTLPIRYRIAAGYYARKGLRK